MMAFSKFSFQRPNVLKKQIFATIYNAECFGGSFNHYPITVCKTMWGKSPKITFEWDFLQTLPPDGLTQDLTPNFEMDWKWCLKATSGSSDANCWGRGTCRQPALRGCSLGEGDEQLLQQAAHHPHHLWHHLHRVHGHRLHWIQRSFIIQTCDYLN